MRQEGRRLYEADMFHDPTAPEAENVGNNVREAARNQKIKDIIENPKILKVNATSSGELYGLIGALAMEIELENKKPVRMESRIAEYERWKTRLEELKKDLDLKLRQQSGLKKFISKIF